MVSITITLPIPEVDELERELANARRTIVTLGHDKAMLQQEIVRLNEGRVADGLDRFSDASYYALRSRFKALTREHASLREQMATIAKATGGQS